MEADPFQHSFDAEAGAPRIDISTLFRDLLPTGETTPGRLAVCAGRQLAAGLSPAWPDLTFGPRRSDLRAVDSGSPTARGAGFVVQAGLLRPPATKAGPWASSTIALSWKGRERRAGIGERLLALSCAARMNARGDAIAAAIAADGQAAPLRRSEAACADKTVLVESDDPAADHAALRRLLQHRPAAEIAVVVRAQRSSIARATKLAGAAAVLVADITPWGVAQAAREVHAPLHHDIALAARLAGRDVFTRGCAVPSATPGLLAAAFLIRGTRYLDPADGTPIACEAFVDRLIEWRRLGRRIPRIACFVGISFWKRRRMAEFADGSARFARTAQQAIGIAARDGGGIAVWPSRAPAQLDAAASAAGVQLFRVEDGFIRSRGLGADFIPPASVIIDGRGIYYDSRQASDLETLLAEHAFPPDLLARARRLIDTLVARRITKYNLAEARQAIAFPQGARRILVPGQVADDLSVRTGGAGVAPGLPLLRAVRQRNPGAFVVYKPHPDVEAGHRPGAVADAALLAHADLVVRDMSMDSLIEAVDEVHTVTSLAGFEALLRRRPVTTYGQPFYAGWGLTTDIHPPARRGRSLAIEQLAAATLILYPHYIDPVTALPCGPEQLVERLDSPAGWQTGALVALRRAQGALRQRLTVRMTRVV